MTPIDYSARHADDRSRAPHGGAHDPRRPDADSRTSPEAIVAAGDQFWPLRAFRELDDAMLRLRLNEPEIGTDPRARDRRSGGGAGRRSHARRAPRPLAGARDRRSSSSGR